MEVRAVGNLNDSRNVSLNISLRSSCKLLHLLILKYVSACSYDNVIDRNLLVIMESTRANNLL